MDTISNTKVKEHLTRFYGIHDAVIKNLNTLANDSFSVVTSQGKFALKIYHKHRTRDAVQWELDLLLHFEKHKVPIAKPVKGKGGYLQTIVINGHDRICLVFEWAPGEKPQPSIATYLVLGKAAGQIHHAADSFANPHGRQQYDLQLLIDLQLQRMEKRLKEANQWEKMVQLSERLNKLVVNQDLDKGVCHMDLTLDNIHIHENLITVFDFDSAGKSWRAIEPYGVLQFSKKYFEAWLDGYRSVRSFNKTNEQAVYAFVIIGEIRNITWKLGLAESSRGEPLMTTNELPEVVDRWLDWEETHL